MITEGVKAHLSSKFTEEWFNCRHVSHKYHSMYKKTEYITTATATYHLLGLLYMWYVHRLRIKMFTVFCLFVLAVIYYTLNKYMKGLYVQLRYSCVQRTAHVCDCTPVYTFQANATIDTLQNSFCTPISRTVLSGTQKNFVHASELRTCKMHSSPSFGKRYIHRTYSYAFKTKGNDYYHEIHWIFW